MTGSACLWLGLFPLMHFGSYVHYPIRNGYIICFVFGYIMCEYAARLYGDDESSKERSYIGLAVLPITAVAFVLFTVWVTKNRGMSYETVLRITACMMAAALAYYLLILNLPYIKHIHIKKGIYSLSLSVGLAEICLGIKKGVYTYGYLFVVCKPHLLIGG